VRSSSSLRHDSLKACEKLREQNSFNRGRRWTIDVEDSEFEFRYLRVTADISKDLKPGAEVE
jgi:hypothetical protein